jgi:hypothetical protein
MEILKVKVDSISFHYFYHKQFIMRFIIFAFIIISSISVKAATTYLDFMDARFIKYYNIDTCKILVEEEDSVGNMVKRVSEIHVFYPSGQAAVSYKIPEFEDEDTVVTLYEYANGLLMASQRMAPGRDTVLTEYFYKNGMLYGKVVTAFDRKEYEIYTNSDGLVLSMIGKTMIPKIDSLTGEPTGENFMGKIEEYEYRYNRFRKVTKEVFTYYDKEYYTKVNDYGPAGNGPLLSQSVYKFGSSTPDTKIVYTYGENNLPSKEETTELPAGAVSNVYFEYHLKLLQPVAVPGKRK